jgi:large subunit ribosomal protein L10
MAYQAKVNQTKTEAVADIKKVFEGASDFFFTNYRGLTVEQITGLRHKLREQGADYHVVKNNYARIAFEQLGKSDVSKLLIGPTAVAIARKDSGPVAKALLELTKDWQQLEVKGGLVGTSVFDGKQTEAFSKLPTRNQLYSMLMGTMQAPLQNLVYVLNGVTTKLVRTLQAVADKKAK